MSNSNLKSSQDSFTDDKFGRWVGTTVAAVCIFAVGVATSYWLMFRGRKISSETGDWGALGDYLGGLINPAIGIATVFLIAVSVVIQRKELRSAREEMEKSTAAAARMSFEQSFFSWLSTYQNLLATSGSADRKGRAFLRSIYEQHFSSGRAAHRWDFPAQLYEAFDADVDGAIRAISDTDPKAAARILTNAVVGYNVAFERNRSELDASLRTLYRLFQWIDQSKLQPEEKWHYAALARAQLSWIELVCLFYNCCTHDGRKMTTYANRYALFDNLNGGDGLVEFARRLFNGTLVGPIECVIATENGLQSAAFDSAVAKQALGVPLDI